MIYLRAGWMKTKCVAVSEGGREAGKKKEKGKNSFSC